MQRRDFLKRSLAISAGAALSHLHTAEALQSAPTLPDFNHLTGHVILRGDPGYEEARLGRNTNVCSFPAVIVFCRQSSDAVRAVDWARTHSIAFRVRCGRHSYEGYSSVDDGMVIDIHDLRSVRFNACRDTVRIGSGMSLAKVYEALWPHKVTIPGGSCPTVGISGHALGGGYGLLARYLGLACDSVLEVEMVMANGKLVRANAVDHPDLYWACRGGGGGNFGVVTSFVLKTHPIDKVSIFHLTWNWPDFDEVVNAWQSWAPVTDNRLTSVLVLKSAANGTFSALGQFLGSSEELRTLLAPLTSAGSPVDVSLQTLSFMDAVQTFSGQTPSRQHWQLHWTGENTHFKHSSDYADRKLTSDAIDVLRHALETAPGLACYVQMEAYGGAINRVPTDATAFVHRTGTLCNLQYQAYWGLKQESPPFIAWVETLKHNMQPFVSGRAYSNYCDSEITDWPRAYYGGNLERLVEVKKKYDPHDLFRFPQSIPLKIS